MPVLLFATPVGAAATLVALWTYNAWIALVAAPIGGSVSCALAGAVLYALRSNRRGPKAEPHTNTALQPQ